ncbi:MAG: FadR/GntR family transcriptional regulator [Desulfobacula sp.]|jgi:DNA-binding FadR family transcriptional regulator
METALQNTTIHKGRISDQIKTILRQAILDGHFKPGDKFPPEIEIAQKYNVSKVSAREALREMETEGLIRKKRGIFGGSFVAEPGSEKMADAVINSYLFGGITATDLAEFRRILEPQLVRLAAERRTDEDLAAMEHCLGEIETCIQEGQPDQTKAIGFHCLIADACHNPFISSLMAAMVGVFQKVLAKTPEHRIAVKDSEYNRQFFECIRQRDGEGAARVMGQHFDTLEDIIKENLSRNEQKN